MESQIQEVVTLYDTGHYLKAFDLAHGLREHVRQIYGVEHFYFAAITGNLAVLHKCMGDYAEAEPLYWEEIEFWLNAGSDGREGLSVSLNNIAEFYAATGKPAGAIPLYPCALATCRDYTSRSGQPDSMREVLQPAKANLEGDFQLAINLCVALQNAGPIEPGHPYSAAINYCLGMSYRQYGDTVKATHLCNDAKHTILAWLGQTGTETIGTCLNNLGSCCSSLADYVAAEQYHRRAMDIASKVVGQCHPSYATDATKIADLLARNGDYASARQMREKAMENRRQTVGEWHPDFADSLSALAALHMHMHDFSEALPLYQRSLRVWQARGGNDSSDAIEMLRNVAFVYRQLGDCARAASIYENVVSLLEKKLGPTDPHVALNLSSLGLNQAYAAWLRARRVQKNSKTPCDSRVKQKTGIGPSVESWRVFE